MMRTNGINNDIAQTETGFVCLGRVHDERITSIRCSSLSFALMKSTLLSIDDLIERLIEV